MKSFSISRSFICLAGWLFSLPLVSSTPLFSQVERPPFLSSVSEQDLRQAQTIARRRHLDAVERALENYPIDNTLPIDEALLQSIQLDRYSINAPGALPDFSADLPREVFVTRTPLLSSDECQKVIQDAEEHFKDGGWTQLRSGQYPVAGFWIKEIPAVHDWFVKTVRQRLFPLLSKTFPDFCDTPEDLCVDNAYLFKYTPETGRRTDIHTDSGCLSFTIALNSAGEYEGGGTWFDGLQLEQDGVASDKRDGSGGVIEMDQGQVTIRPGGVKHRGNPVHKGVRYVIGGFCMHRGKVEAIRQLSSPAISPEDPSFTRRKALEAAVVLNPSFDAPYNLLADAYKDEGESIPKQTAALEYCLENVHPYSSEVAYALGSIYTENEEPSKAKDCFLRCLRADHYDVDSMVGVMVMAASLGETDVEAEYANRIIETPGATDKAMAQAYCNLGVLFTDKPEEIGYYEKAIALEPMRFAPRYSLACAHAAQENWTSAVREFRSALTVANEGSDVSPEEKERALKHLYRTAMKCLQKDFAGSAQPSREEMMKKFAEIMGEENFRELMARASNQ